MGSNIVHQYFKKEIDGTKIIVKINPIHLKGTEIIVLKKGVIKRRELEFDVAIFDDLKTDGFIEASPLEFNLYESGLA